MLTSDTMRDTLAFQVDLWPARGGLPTTLEEVAERQKDIQYSSRTRMVTDQLRRVLKLRHGLQQLLERLPEAERGAPELAEIRRLAKTPATKDVYKRQYLKNWDKLFESPFKSDVIFFSTRLQLGRRWGTAQPVTLRDSEFGMVRLRAFGVYSYQITDPAKFYREISGTRDVYTVDDLEAQLRNMVVAAMTTALGGSKVPFLDIAGNQGLMSQSRSLIHI